MPRGDGTGPSWGSGPGTGRGAGRGRRGAGRMGGSSSGAGPAGASPAGASPAGLGPGGECVCSACGTKVPHQAGVPCYNVTCPKCGSGMIRG